MAKGIHKLTDSKINRLSKPGRYADGGGLYLQIEKGGSKNWIFRKAVAGKDSLTGLGSLRDLDLDAAREKAGHIRSQVAEGRNPQAARTSIKTAAEGITFEAAARRYIDTFKSEWKNPTHRNQWFRSMLGEDDKGQKVEAEHDYTKSLRPLDVRDIHLEQVEAVLKPIWSSKAETARRIRGRIEAVLDWSTGKKFRTGDNPARWKGNLRYVLPSQSDREETHHAALHYTDMPEFMGKLAKQPGDAAKALRFAILTVVRTSSIIGIEGRDDTPALDWDHIDMAEKTWTIPRVKNDDTDFVIPLSDPAMQILHEMRRLTAGKGVVFRGAGRDDNGEREPMSNGAMLSVFRRMKVDATTHGLARAGFESWADEATDATDKLIAAVMSHGRSKTRSKAKAKDKERVEKSEKLKRAYSRDQLLPKRRELMNAWAKFLTTAPSPALKVVA